MNANEIHMHQFRFSKQQDGLLGGCTDNYLKSQATACQFNLGLRILQRCVHVCIFSVWSQTGPYLSLRELCILEDLSAAKICYSWISHGLQSRSTSTFLLWLSNFKTKTSFGDSHQKNQGSFFSNSQKRSYGGKRCFEQF